MYSPAALGWRYLQYYCTASNGKGHGVHAPFVFELITKVLNDDRNFYAYAPVEELRNELLRDNRMITVADFGAGSRVRKENTRKLGDIAASSLKPKKFGQLLFRLVNYYAPQTILELGTSLGITTSYMALAKKDAKLITMEGAPEIAKLAKQHFARLDCNNIELCEGNFDDTLKEVLQKNPVIDFAFIDGNHRYEPTMRYFEQLLPVMQDHAVLIFDDIHWSREMEQAWTDIQQHPAVTLSVDLFFIGLIFFRKEQKVKQHFTIRF